MYASDITNQFLREDFLISWIKLPGDLKNWTEKEFCLIPKGKSLFSVLSKDHKKNYDSKHCLTLENYAKITMEHVYVHVISFAKFTKHVRRDFFICWITLHPWKF